MKLRTFTRSLLVTLLLAGSALALGGESLSTIKRLKDLVDVSNTAPTDGQILSYTASTGQWTPATGGSGSGDASHTDKLSAFANTTSAELAGVITNETGSGLLVYGTSPTLTTPALGVATATSVNGTTIPSSKTLVVTTDTLAVHGATTSAELAGVISNETGSGLLVFATSPSLTTPNIGAATATTVNGASLPVAATLGYQCIRMYPTTVAGDLVAGTNEATAMARQAMTVTNVYAHLNTAGTTSAPTFDINEAGTSIISTKLTIDATETDSSTAATPAVISDSAIAANAQLSVDVDSADSGNTGVGAEVDVCGYPTGAPQ